MELNLQIGLEIYFFQTGRSPGQLPRLNSRIFSTSSKEEIAALVSDCQNLRPINVGT